MSSLGQTLKDAADAWAEQETKKANLRADFLANIQTNVSQVIQELTESVTSECCAELEDIFRRDT